MPLMDALFNVLFHPMHSPLSQCSGSDIESNCLSGATLVAIKSRLSRSQEDLHALAGPLISLKVSRTRFQRNKLESSKHSNPESEFILTLQ
jgi:hypothetical protein